MDPDSWLAWLGLLVAVLVIAFSNAGRASLGGVSKANVRRLRGEGASRADALLALVEDPARFVLALQILDVLGIVAAIAAIVWLAQNAGLMWRWQILVLVLVGGLVIVCVQVVSRAWAFRSVDSSGIRLAGAVRVVARIFSPLVMGLRTLADLIMGRSADDVSADSLFFSEDQLRFLIDSSEEPGLIEEDEKKMIASIFQLGETLVRELMVPRIDLVAVEEQTSLEDALDVIIKAGHSRIPVYRGNIDHVQGLLYAKDMLPPFRDGLHDLSITQLMRPAYFVPESKKVDDLLRELQKRKVHMAVIVDEYGGTAGAVTIEDLLEEIVGDIQDEYDTETPLAVQLGEREFVFDAQIRLDEVSEMLDVEFETEESDTLGGFIYSILGSIPVVGSRVEYDGLNLEVISVQGHRILQVKVSQPKPRSEPVEEPHKKRASQPASTTT
ncbi:MAG: HlyC/CorC family transporter [Anaerolineae bacterium]|nr:HlyC/CorC family transporter [Anaerolineae bacterium]MCB9131269.1 HlyC/CorC family transporter [Anaerolineales bacterium]MCB0228538.1 HlyC/CorC family transporter [Anaerolineae bacterium]MCB0239909.1 HlyC/CorC family transporter [Anaerolineae bacterium]MCB0247188.1 HlyC/CorC family transporter [Anaerolineae bacterium]